jgi:hypothetical protein
MRLLLKKINSGLIAVFIFTLLLLGSTPSQSQAQGRVMVTYFHSDVRCTTCLAFEDWSKTAVDGFAKELADGTLQWQVINFDQDVNQHFIKDYDLAEKSLVLVKEEDGKPVRWKNVEEFWDFDENQKEEFVSLVRNMITDYLQN